METEPYPKQALYLAAPALAALVGVHLLPDAGGVDPVRELMSEYPVRSDVGALYTLALLVANVAVMILGVHWVRHGILRSRPGAAVLLAAWCLSLLGLTVFLKDPAGSHGTLAGAVHMVCTVVNFAAMPALCALLWWQHRRDARWRAPATAVGVVAVLTAACVVPFAVVLASGEPGALSSASLGLVERVVVGLDVVAVVVLAGWSGRAARPDAPRPSSAR